MGITRLREGIRWICSQCGNIIPTGKGIQIDGKPYCELCGNNEFEGFKEKVENMFKEAI